jgi:hypothetical protein
MKFKTTRRGFLSLITSALAGLAATGFAQDTGYNPLRPGGGGGGDDRGGGGRGRQRKPDEYVLPPELSAFAALSLILGRVSGNSVTVSALSRDPVEAWFEYGTAPGAYSQRTSSVSLPAGKPVETVFAGLQPDTPYFYRLNYRAPGAADFTARPECTFRTQRPPGSSFTFGIQGDSHPERPQMSDPNLYARTLLDAAAGKPDFYICMGDDFSVDALHEVNAETLVQPYTLQRPFLGLVAQSAPLFLLNGNHEQASLFNFIQTDIRHEVAVAVQNARNTYYPTPMPDGFYTGDTQSLEGIGRLKDYYSWTWGDVLFVVLDNYWHSPQLVDSGFQERGQAPGEKGHDRSKNRDWWQLTMGNAQYQWFRQTLEQSTAKYKLVFAHHVLGSGRGGVDGSDLYEWGGHNKRGDWEFTEKRPGWELPVHQLMVKHKVDIFFQGHDHLFAHQERDGLIYQEVPMPADQGYMTYNEDRYASGVKLPNAGHLRVTVTPAQLKVDYIRCFLPQDETAQHKTGDVAFSYTVPPKGSHV